MRLDKFLKVSRIIKRRTVSKEAILNGAVKLNGLVPKPGTEVKLGDIISLQTPRQSLEFEVVGFDKDSQYVRSNNYEKDF